MTNDPRNNPAVSRGTPDDPNVAVGRYGYDAYGRRVGGNQPKWDDLPNDHRGYWDAAGNAMRNYAEPPPTVNSPATAEGQIAQENRKSIGRYGYDAYGEGSGWRSYNGESMPRWDNLDARNREYWDGLGNDVRDHYRRPEAGDVPPASRPKI